MTKREVQQRIDKLRKLINHHRYLYHVLNKQEISEAALDSLKKELFDLEQQYSQFITPDSPTQRVAGEAQEQFQKVEHTHPMLSLQDGFSQQDMTDWEERIKKLLSESEARQLDYFCEPKIDGLAVSLIYKKGVLARGATRGNGRVGEDVTSNLKTIESIPLRLEKAIDCEVRGEVFMSKSAFVALNEEQLKKGEAPYANPRNTAAGSIRQLDPKIAASRKLSFLAWQLIGRETQQQEEQELKELGFKPVEGRYCQGLGEVFQHHQATYKHREDFPFHIDGLVVSVNNNDLFKKLGVAGKAPRGAIAFKFPLMESQTIVEDIKVQVGRTGAITPVARLRPVQIGGVTITRATLHNEDETKRLGLKIGDTVIVGRAGDVIPQVLKVLKELRTGKEKPFLMPKKCPDCCTLLTKKPEEVVWRCLNPRCYVRRVRQLYHFVSKQTFDIKGLGPKIVDQLLKQGLITDAADIFEIKEGDLLPLERFAEKSAQNLVRAIEASKQVSLARFIFALGIRGVGEETSIDLANTFGSIEKLSKAAKEELLAVKDIGPAISQSIHAFFREERNLALIGRLLKAGVKIPNSKFHPEGVPPAAGPYGARIPNSKFQGKIFVLTGALESLSRVQAKEKIRALGGDVAESVSKNTDFVVVGKDPGSKFAQAKKLGVRILNEKEFLSMLR